MHPHVPLSAVPRISVRSAILATVAAVLAAGLAAVPTAAADPCSKTLYGTTGGDTAGSLYTIDPDTGTATEVGSLGDYAVTGLAQDPTTGILYGSTSNLSPTSPRSLITIDPDTGAGTLVGAFGAADGPVADIAFRSDGGFYGWMEGWSGTADDFVSIDKSTGAATIIGDSGLSTRGDGMDFGSTGVLYALLQSSGGPLRTVDTATGLTTSLGDTTVADPDYDDVSVAAGSFGCETDVMTTVLNPGSGSTTPPAIYNLDVTTREFTLVGETTDGMDGLAWVEPASPSVKTTQRPADHCAVKPERVPNSGLRKLAKAGCETNAGQPVGVKVVARKTGASTSDRTPPDLNRTHTLYCKAVGKKAKATRSAGYGKGFRYCRTGKLYLRTYDQWKKLTITWKAPATDDYTKYERQRVYRS